MAMTTLPSAVRGNLQASSEQIRHQAPSFEKHLKSSRNMQLKPLKVERRFSHYEQKIANAPIERCSTKMPRRLQTRKLSRPIKPMFEEERIKWNERLAAWLREDQSSTVEYIKFNEQFTLIEKQLYYCSACHEFFHLNLKERDNRRISCPKFKGHHDDHVRPVSIHKVKKPRKKRPTVVPKDPFGDRSNLKVPSLNQPRPIKRSVRVVMDVPPLPPIPKAPSRKKILPPAPAPSQNSSRIPAPSPTSTTPQFTPIIVNDDTIPSPISLPNLVVSPEAENTIEQQEPEIEETVIDEPQREEEPEETQSQESLPGEGAVTEFISTPPQSTRDIEEDGRDSVKSRGVLSFNRHELNDIYECSDLESVEHGIPSEKHDRLIGSPDTDDGSHGEMDVDSIVDDPELEAELQLPSPELEESPSPQRNRPRPPPPDLPDLDFSQSPDLRPIKKKKPPLKKRKAMILPPTKKVEPKPVANSPKPEKPKAKRMTSDEIARRMRKAKEIDGYRKKYAFGTEDEYEVTTDDNESVTSQDLNLYDDSFLEKYCLVSKEQLRKCKRAFAQFDQDGDGLLKTEEVVNAIHKMFSPKVIEDVEMCYIFRILETTSFDIFTDKMNLKLFSIVVSLAEKISQLDKYMKHLIGKINAEVVDWKLHEYRRLFEFTMRRDARGNYSVPMESLWLELHAGGISVEHEKQARRELGHMKELNLLDFLTYLPLFILVHSNVVENPLNGERYI